MLYLVLDAVCSKVYKVVSFLYVEPEMKNIGQKKKLCAEKKIFTPKMATEMYLKNGVITYKSRILKFKIQQKLSRKKMQNDKNYWIL